MNQTNFGSDPRTNRTGYCPYLCNYSDLFLFHKCCKLLEHVSIWDIDEVLGHLPPFERKYLNFLIKFVWNSLLSLYWLQSNITLGTMHIIYMETPKNQIPQLNKIYIDKVLIFDPYFIIAATLYRTKVNKKKNSFM